MADQAVDLVVDQALDQPAGLAVDLVPNQATAAGWAEARLEAGLRKKS